MRVSENSTTIKTTNLLFFMMLLLFFRIGFASESIFVERYSHWRHPIMKVFEKYSIYIQKVVYSDDGKCPTFYARFKYNPDPRTPSSMMYNDKVYDELLRANSFFPYVLVDKKDNLRINVGLANKKKTKMIIHLSEANSFSICKDGDGNPDNEEYIVDQKMKESIFRSQFNVALRRKDGKKVIAYLYAQDEKEEPDLFPSCKTGKIIETDIKTGHYYIYLYDVSSRSFYPNRTAVLKSRYTVNMYDKESNLFVLSSPFKDQSDVLLIGQRGDCNNNFYEAYGFGDDLSSIQSYPFNDTEKFRQFAGHLDKIEPHEGELFASTIYKDKLYRSKIFISKNKKEIQIKPL